MTSISQQETTIVLAISGIKLSGYLIHLIKFFIHKYDFMVGNIGS